MYFTVTRDGQLASAATKIHGTARSCPKTKINGATCNTMLGRLTIYPRVANFLQCTVVPKIMEIGWPYTQILQKISGLLFLAHPVYRPYCFFSVLLRYCYTYDKSATSKVGNFPVYKELRKLQGNMCNGFWAYGLSLLSARRPPQVSPRRICRPTGKKSPQGRICHAKISPLRLILTAESPVGHGRIRPIHLPLPL